MGSPISQQRPAQQDSILQAEPYKSSPTLLPFPLAAPGLLSAEPLRVTRGVPLPGTAPPAGAKSRVRPQIAD